MDKVLEYLELSSQEKDTAHANMTVSQRQDMATFMKTMHVALQSICRDEFYKMETEMEK